MLKHAIAVLTGLAIAWPATAAPLKRVQPNTDCLGIVSSQLKKHDIEPSMVDMVWYETEYRTDEEHRIKGFQAWADMKSCRGNVVVQLRANCQLIDTYSTGGCLFDGMKRH